MTEHRLHMEKFIILNPAARIGGAGGTGFNECGSRRFRLQLREFPAGMVTRLAP
jgi:hypothetical protein